MRFALLLVAWLATFLVGCSSSSKSPSPTASSDDTKGEPSTSANVSVSEAKPVLPSSSQTVRENRHDRIDATVGTRRANGPVFFGLPVTGRRVAFAISRAGGMTDTMQDTKELLKRSIQHLMSDQQFDVIFWRAGPAIKKPGGMVPATLEQLTFGYIHGR